MEMIMVRQRGVRVPFPREWRFGLRLLRGRTGPPASPRGPNAGLEAAPFCEVEPLRAFQLQELLRQYAPVLYEVAR